MYIQLEFEYLQSIYSELLVCLSLIFNRKQFNIDTFRKIIESKRLWLILTFEIEINRFAFNIDISLNEHKRQSLLLSNQIL